VYGSARRTGNSFGKLPHPEPNMETRLIIAYALIAIMIALAIFGGIKLSQKKNRTQRRDSGNGEHMRREPDQNK
jgi:hypothetical protein